MSRCIKMGLFELLNSVWLHGTLPKVPNSNDENDWRIFVPGYDLRTKWYDLGPGNKLSYIAFIFKNDRTEGYVCVIGV